MEEERPIWAGTPSQVTNLATYVGCGLVSLFLLAFLFSTSLPTYAVGTVTVLLFVPLFIAFHRWLQTRFTNYEITTERLRLTTGILSRRTEELELYRVKDSSFHQSLALRVFGLGDILLRTSDPSTPVTLIHAVSNGPALRDEIRACVEKLRERKGVRELDV